MDLINFQTLIIQTINISIVVFVLWRFLFKPYLAFIDSEAEKQRLFEENTLAAAHLISNASKEAVSIVEAAKVEARTMLTDSEGLAKKEYSLIIADARNESEQMKQKASKDIENERLSLYTELREKVLSIALRANEKLFGKNEANVQFITKIIKEEN